MARWSGADGKAVADGKATAFPSDALLRQGMQESISERTCERTR